MNAPDPLHWTLNSRIAAFHSVWVHFGLFRYCTKLGPKRAELVQLMQKFFQEVALEFFATNATDAPHWTLNSCLWATRSVCVYLVIFRYYRKLGGKWVEYGVINAQVRAMKSHRNFSQ